MPAFMEKAVHDNDFVLMVCTPKYKAKYENRNGGAGYEGDIIQGEVFIRKNHRKFIPILRRGNWEEVAPSALLGAYYIDLRDGSGYTSNYQDLILTLQGQRSKPPDLGTANFDQPIHWTLVLDGICDDSVKSRVEALAKHLQQLLGDSSLTIEKIQKGSIIVHFRGVRTGFDEMKALFESGRITHLDGLKILGVSEVDDFKMLKFKSLGIREVIEAFLGGDAEAGDEFVKRMTPVIDRVLRKRLGQRFKPLRKLESQDESSLFAPVKVVAAKVGVDRFRAMDVGRAANEVITLDAASNSSAGQEAERGILFEEIDRVIRSVASEQERTIFWLFFRGGYTAKAIASLPGIGLSVKKVENMLSRLIRSVKLKISDADVDECWSRR